MGHPQRGSNKRRGKKQSQPISNLKQAAGCQNPTLGQTSKESMVSSSLMKTEQNELSNSTIVEEDATAVMIGHMTDTTTLLSDDDNRTDTSFDFTDIASCSNSVVSYISDSRDKQIAAVGIASDIGNSSYEIILAEDLKAWEAMPDLSEPSSELSKSRQYHNSNTTIERVRGYFEKCSIHYPGRTSYLPSSSNNDLQGHMSRMGCYGRSYIDDLAGSGTSSEQTQTRDVKEKNHLYEHELSSNKIIGVQKWSGPTPIEDEKTWPALTHQHSSNIEVISDVLEESYVLTDGASYIASSSKSDLQGSNMSFKRSWLEVLAGPISRTSSIQTRTQDSKGKSTLHDPDSWVNVVKKGSHTQDIKGKSQLHDPDSWVKVVKKDSHMQKHKYLSKETTKKQHIPGDDYKTYRHNANQHWENQKSLIEQARNAYASGKWDDVVTLSCQAKMWKEKAEQADEKASQDIFDSRNKNNIVDLMTIDLHGQHVKEGMTILKYHLAFGVYGRSLRRLRVITGYGSGGNGQSKLKEAVVDLLKTEKFGWVKENEGSLLIKFDMKKRKLGFVKL